MGGAGSGTAVPLEPTWLLRSRPHPSRASPSPQEGHTSRGEGSPQVAGSGQQFSTEAPAGSEGPPAPQGERTRLRQRQLTPHRRPHSVEGVRVQV